MPIEYLNKFPDQNPNPVMRFSRQGHLVYANKASLPLLSRWRIAEGKRVQGKALATLNDAVGCQCPITTDFRFRNRIYTVTFTPIADSNYINIYGLDTTDKKQIENSLTAALHEVKILRNRLQRENRRLRDEVREDIDDDTMIGNSEIQSQLFRKIDQVAATDATVLITGETGTGKELIARAIHEQSLRHELPLIKINCAALPTNLIESELFGHEKGAFTGAVARKLGRFEIADGRTLFLDEIGDIPLESQAKLLRVLQEQEFERVGGNHSLGVDVRVIAATNRVLTDNIAAGSFREDLFYRLNVFPIHSAPLRDHIDDLAILADHFLRKYSAKFGKSITAINANVMARLQNYHWPGNVRELENIIERAVILTEGASLQLDEIFDQKLPIETACQRTLGEVEQEMIQSALADCKWKIEGVGGAARRLAMAPSTLRERIKKYGLKRNPPSWLRSIDHH